MAPKRSRVAAHDEAEFEAKRAARAPAAAAARQRWATLAASGSWDEVRMPARCFRFTEL